MCTTSESDSFHPFRLSSDASLNRTPLAALAGADERWVGRRAFDLLSLAALRDLAADHGFEIDTRPVVVEYARRLGHLIATLLSPPRSEPWNAWRAAYLQHWRQIERIWLGGGIAAALGPKLADAVQAEAQRLLDRPVQIEIASHPSVLAVIGCARSQSACLPHVIALDFGGSNVKRGVGSVIDGRLHRLDLLDVLRAPASPESVTKLLVSTVAETFQIAVARFGTVDPRVVVSLAAYMPNGLPVDRYSLYERLGGVSLESLEDELLRRTGARLQLSYLHDGTAAGRALPDRGRAAVIMLGTALGVGFCPPPEDVLAAAPDLIVE